MQKLVDAAQTADLAGRARVSAEKEAVRRYARHCSDFKQPSTRSAVIQLLTTLVPLLTLGAAAIWLAGISPFLALPLALPIGGLLVRCFIIQHDCGHGSFVASRLANTIIGRLMSVFTLTPYALWRRTHAMHHAGSGNLDRRGIGDIKTLTVDEYLVLGRLARLRYRIYRNPVFLFLVGVPAFFLILQRLPWGHPVAPKDCWLSVLALDLAIIPIYGGLAWAFGPATLAAIVVPSLFVAAGIGGWLFFIQHQFEEAHWNTASDWDFQVAAVHGSSYYDLPAVLHWFTGNIGLHHIHHLNSTIPNYRLKECLEALPELAGINRLTLRDSLGCARLSLWDAKARCMIGFSDLALRHPGKA